MSLVISHIAISVDGFVAGPNQSVDNPLGEGGERLHEWVIRTASWREQHGLEGGERSLDAEVVDEVVQNVGAYVMGRNMFGPGRGDWDNDWTGWWGEEPPFHTPVFVLSHFEREPLTMKGGTSFTFVTDGVQSAMEQARAAAGDLNVSVAGGASTIAQFLAAGLLDELYLHIVPIVLGDGERLFAGAGEVNLEPVKVVASPTVTHIKYRIVH